VGKISKTLFKRRKKMEFKTKIVETATNEIRSFYESVEKSANEKEQMRKSYTGDLLAEKLKELNSNLEEKRLKCIEAINKEIMEFKSVYIDSEKDRILSGETMTKDHALLKISTSLTADELKILCDRNKSDYIFIRACNEYAKARNITFEYISTMPKREEMYKECMEFFAQFTRENIVTEATAFESQKSYFDLYNKNGGFTNLDERIYFTIS
jgi:hypothetical protein